MIRFGFGQSPFLPPPNVLRALEKSAHHKEYTSVQGDPELRSLMSDFHRRHNGLKVDPDHILVAPGSKILLYTVMLAFDRLDVLIPVPSWVSYAPQAKLAGHNIIKVHTDFNKRWRIDTEALANAIREKKCKESILILNYPGNPDGLTYQKEELNEIADFARNYNITIISDEIYGLLDHNLHHHSMVEFYPERTITTTGLSKWCGAGGWRFGAAFLYDEVEKPLKEALMGIASETYSCAPAPIQMAAKEAYKSYDNIHGYLNYQVNILKEVGHHCVDTLRQEGVKIHDPQGAFYLFPDFSDYKAVLKQHGVVTSRQFCETLLSETGVALLPGTAFGCSDDALVARLAYVDFREPAVNEAFDLHTHGAHIVEGIEKISQWLRKL